MGFASVKSNSPGKAASDSTKSDSKLPQHGGEGREVKVAKGDVSYTPAKGTSYGGPGRTLKSESF